MSNQLKRHQSMEPLNNPGEAPQLTQSMLRSHLIIQILLSCCFLFSTLYMQGLCMVEKICGMSGIEVDLTYQQSILAFYFFNILFLYVVNHALDTVNQNMIMIVKWPLLVFSIITGIFGVIAIILQAQLKADDPTLQAKWSKLGALAKSGYSNEIGNLMTENQRNLLLIAIYHFGNCLLLAVIFCFMFNYQMNMPKNWRPPYTYRLTNPMPLIYKAQPVVPIVEEEEEVQNEDHNDQFGPPKQPETVFQKKPSRFQKKQVSDRVDQSEAQSFINQQNQSPEKEGNKQPVQDTAIQQRPFS